MGAGQRRSPRETDHGSTAVAVVGIHAETDGVWGGIVFEADGTLTARAADDVEGHGGRGRIGGRSFGSVCLWLDLDGGRAHGEVERRDWREMEETMSLRE